MLSSFVIRVAPAALAAGQLAGDVEHVETGGRGSFADAQELTTWCAAITGAVELMAMGPQSSVDDEKPCG